MEFYQWEAIYRSKILVSGKVLTAVAAEIQKEYDKTGNELKKLNGYIINVAKAGEIFIQATTANFTQVETAIETLAGAGFKYAKDIENSGVVFPKMSDKSDRRYDENNTADIEYDVDTKNEYFQKYKNDDHNKT